jgi:hypothetical protein
LASAIRRSFEHLRSLFRAAQLVLGAANDDLVLVLT